MCFGRFGKFLDNTAERDMGKHSAAEFIFDSTRNLMSLILFCGKIDYSGDTQHGFVFQYDILTKLGFLCDICHSFWWMSGMKLVAKVCMNKRLVWCQELRSMQCGLIKFCPIYSKLTNHSLTMKGSVSTLQSLQSVMSHCRAVCIDCLIILNHAIWNSSVHVHGPFLHGWKMS